MRALDPFGSNPADDERTDRALRDLLGSTPPPQLHEGFEHRLARAVETGHKRLSSSRRVRRIMRAYWIVAALASTLILWSLGSPAEFGPGLWLGIGGFVSLCFASLSFWLLAPLPTKRRPRAAGR